MVFAVLGMVMLKILNLEDIGNSTGYWVVEHMSIPKYMSWRLTSQFHRIVLKSKRSFSFELLI